MKMARKTLHGFPVYVMLKVDGIPVDATHLIDAIDVDYDRFLDAIATEREVRRRVKQRTLPTHDPAEPDGDR